MQQSRTRRLFSPQKTASKIISIVNGGKAVKRWSFEKPLQTEVESYSVPPGMLGEFVASGLSVQEFLQLHSDVLIGPVNCDVVETQSNQPTPLQADGVWKRICSQTAGLGCSFITSLQAAGNPPLID
jgi:hypothetical protein